MKNTIPHSHQINNYTWLVLLAIVGSTDIEHFYHCRKLDNPVLDHEFLKSKNYLTYISVYPAPTIVPEKEQTPNKYYLKKKKANKKV